MTKTSCYSAGGFLFRSLAKETLLVVEGKRELGIERTIKCFFCKRHFLFQLSQHLFNKCTVPLEQDRRGGVISGQN